MSITAEAFSDEHFAKLTRGMAIAEESYQLLQRRINDLDTQLTEAHAAISKRDEELEERPTLGEWQALLEFIGDVERGVRTPEELFAEIRERNYV